MFKATRELIKQRQPHSEFALEVVTVQKRPSMTRGRCQRNAQEQINSNDDLMLVSGWLIYPFNAITNSTEIVQHWWNFSISNKAHFDVTIGDFEDCEYLTDLSLHEYASYNYDRLASTVGKSLLLKNGKFETVEEISGALEYSEIETFETKNIFRHL